MTIAGSTLRRAKGVVVVLLSISFLTGCVNTDPFTAGAPMGNDDTETVFNKLMRLPDIEQAKAQYAKMSDELRRALTASFPQLRHWQPDGEEASSACGNDYPGIESDGKEWDLLSYFVSRVKLSDSDYERALRLIGDVAHEYGFSRQPQRMHDGPEGHDAVFHNLADASSITFGSAKNTLIGVTIGCHLTPEAKRRGHPSGS